MAYRNIRIAPFLRLIYFLLRALVWVSLRVLYRRRLVLGREHFRFDGPAIVIVNHPSTLMDVLNPALEIRQEMFFLANYGLFKHPVSNWLLRRLFCIPVKRKEDVVEGEERNNLQAFEQSFEHLEKNGVLFIAAEGTSWMNRFVRPLKSGAARIAFGAEARNNWSLEVKIIPIGLSYSAPDQFRSDVVVQAGAPVYPRQWATLWQQQPGKAVDALMAHLEDQLKKLSIHTRGEAGEMLITRLEEMLRNERPLSQRADFARTQHLTQIALDTPELYRLTGAYFQQLQKRRLSDAAVVAALKPGLPLRYAWNAFLLLLGFPFFLAGYAFWFLPCFIPWLVNKSLKFYIGYSTTVKMLVGLFTFPPALWGACRLAELGGVPGSWSWLAVLLAGLLGLFVEQYQDLFRRFRACHTGLRWLARNPGKIRALQQQRARILALV